MLASRGCPKAPLTERRAAKFPTYGTLIPAFCMLARRRASGVLQRATRSSLRRAVKPALAALYSTEVTPPQEYNAKRLDKPRRDVFDQAAANPSYGIFIKPWDGIKSIVEAYAVIRGVEKQYGQLREYKFMRVSIRCSLSRYATILNAYRTRI